MFDMRMQIYRHLQRLDLRFYDRNPVGRLMTRVTTDVDVINDLFTSGVVSIFGDVFTLAGIMIVMLTMNWRLALVAFAVLPLIVARHAVVPAATCASRTAPCARLIARINALPAGAHHRHGDGAAVPPRGARLRSGSTRINQEHRDANVDSIFYYAVFYPAIEVDRRAGVGADHLVTAARCVLPGTLTLGSLVAFLLYSQRFFRPDQRHVGEVQHPAGGDGLVGADLQAARRAGRASESRRVPESLPAVARSAKRAERGHIVFDHVWFAYNPTGRTGEPDCVLRDVSFEVQPGERVGIVGATGAGKSTLINLLLRFYDVTRGRILVDGVDVREMDLHELRALFSLVLQDVHLFTGTIAEQHPPRRRRRSPTRRVRRRRAAVHADSFIVAPARRATRRPSPNAAPRCRSGRSSCCRSPARWRSTRASSSSTRRRRASTPRPRS